MKMIYLDNNATTILDPEVLAEMNCCDRQQLVNPSSQHRLGQAARRVLETAKQEIAKLLGAVTDGTDPDRILITSGGTESNNLALFGLVGSPPGNLVISTIEHPSIVEVAKRLSQIGFEIRWLPVSAEGTCRTGELAALIDDQTRLVSIMFGNNETGVRQPIENCAEICRSRGVPFHTDAVQVAGKLLIDFRELNVSAMTISAHKFHGPRGTGVLLLRPEVDLQPQLFGGHQQMGFRPGTESVSLVVGMAKALRLYAQNADALTQQLTDLRARFELGLQAEIREIVFNGQATERLPHTSNVSFLGVDRQALMIALDLEGICCSTGSSCASGSSDPSPVLSAMGLPEEAISSALRFSVSRFTSEAEVDESCRRISNVVKRLRKQKRV